MIEIRQSVELPKEIEAFKAEDGAVVLRASGLLGLYALNRTVELVQESAADLREVLLGEEGTHKA